MLLIGVLLALFALFAWGVGDFLIQRGARRTGVLQSMTYIGLAGAIIFAPFALPRLSGIGSYALGLLAAAAVVSLVAALLDFIALRKGKLAVVQPVLVLEIPFAAILGTLLLGESLLPVQLILIGLLFVGVILVVLARIDVRSTLEHGALLAVLAAIGIAGTDILWGASGRASSPVVTIWAVHGFLALAGIAALAVEGRLGTLWNGLRSNPRTVLGLSILDNLAWFAFMGAALYMPVAVAVAISEGFVAVSVLLGVFLNKERLRSHQWAGVIVCLAMVVALSLM